MKVVPDGEEEHPSGKGLVAVIAFYDRDLSTEVNEGFLDAGLADIKRYVLAFQKKQIAERSSSNPSGGIVFNVVYSDHKHLKVEPYSEEKHPDGPAIVTMFAFYDRDFLAEVYEEHVDIGLAEVKRAILAFRKQQLAERSSSNPSGGN
jgi:hypothetical protein